MKYIIINSIFHIDDKSHDIYNIGVTEDPNEATQIMLNDYKSTLEKMLYTEEEIEQKICMEKEIGVISNTEALYEYNDEEYHKWQIIQIN